MRGTRVQVLPHHRPALLPVASASLQHRCCLHGDAVPEEFAVISTEVLDCFATAFYAAPVSILDAGQLRFECALIVDDDDGRLKLRLRCAVELPGGGPRHIGLDTPAVLYIMTALRNASSYKQFDLTPVVCNDDLECEFSAGYPGDLRVADLPGIGETLADGEPCWPTTVLHAPLPSPSLTLQARAIVEWLRSGAEMQLH